jgi:hypothetical protein
LLMRGARDRQAARRDHPAGADADPAVALFQRKGRAKVELALARGKKVHDKRETIKERDWKREQGRSCAAVAEPGMGTERGFWGRFMDRHAPSKDEVLESRWLKPFGARVRRSDLWRFTRRSVPRAVFAGCSSAFS